MDLLQLLAAAVRIYTFLVVGRALFSWLPPSYRQNDAYGFLRMVTDPVLRPFQRILPPTAGIDFSPILAIVALEVLRRLLLR